MTKVLSIDIELHEPMLATGIEGDPNSALGLSYVPGSLLRGAAIGRYQVNKDATDPEFRRLFLDGTTRFLHGYPVVNGRRTLPCPHSLMRDKYRSGSDRSVHDHAVATEIDSSIQWQSVSSSSPFLILSESPARGCRPSRTIQVHTNRDRRLGRAVENSGAVFRYESVSPNQLFRAHLICEDQDQQALSKLLTGDVCLGGSRTAGYGHASLRVNEQVLDASTWSEAGNSIPSSDFTGTLRITLLSDAILNDPKSGQHSTSPQTILAAISPAFGGQIPDLSQCKIFSRSTIVGGFNRKWGLPLVQTVAVSMGSVIVIPVYRVSATGVATLIKSGIGQRRTEGYGRLAVNWQLNPSFKLQMHSLDVASRSENPPSNELTFVQNRLRQLRIEHEISSQAMQVRGEKIPKDCRSRVQNLRLQVLQEIRDNSSGYNETKGVGGYIAKIRNRRTVCDKYDRIRVRDSQTVKRILDWLKEFLSSRSSVTLTVPDLSNATSKQEQLKGAEAYKIRLRVAHLVLGRLVKESKRASRQNQGAE